MDETRAVQLAIEATLVVGCLVGYRVESKRAERGAPQKLTLERLQVVGEGEWVLVGVSEDASFEAVSATPELVCEGFELEGERGRVAVPRGTRLRIVDLNGARRAPLDAITRDGVVRPRFSYELKPGTEVWIDVILPVQQAYRSQEVAPAAPIVLGGSRKAVASTDAGAFPGCWLMILGSFGAFAVVASLAGWLLLGWIGIGFATALMLFGWIAMPPAQ